MKKTEHMDSCGYGQQQGGAVALEHALGCRGRYRIGERAARVWEREQPCWRIEHVVPSLVQL